MKTHTTNYFNTLIEIAEDCPVLAGEVPPVKSDTKSVAYLQFKMIHNHPYKYTSDDILFQVYAQRNDLSEQEKHEARNLFFSKGQACLRASPLAKRYGWGIHHNTEGKVALYGIDSEQYQTLSADENLTRLKAMRSKR